MKVSSAGALLARCVERDRGASCVASCGSVGEMTSCGACAVVDAAAGDRRLSRDSF